MVTVAALLNYVVGRKLISEGRRHQSLILEADGRHLLTDVWTTVGVVVAIAAVGITGWDRLDPLIAILVAVNIIVTGAHLVRTSTAEVNSVRDVCSPSGVIRKCRRPCELIVHRNARPDATYFEMITLPFAEVLRTQSP